MPDNYGAQKISYAGQHRSRRKPAAREQERGHRRTGNAGRERGRTMQEKGGTCRGYDKGNNYCGTQQIG